MRSHLHLIGRMTVGLGLCANAAFAESRYDEGLSLRLPAALSRFSGYADVAATGNASAASKWSTSINPASTSWQKISTPMQLVLTPQASYIGFNEGTSLWVLTESVLWDTGELGVFLPAAAQARSNHATTRQDMEFGFDADVFQIQWAPHRQGDWSFGLNFNFSRSKVKFESGDIELADSDTDTYDLRAGLLYQIDKRIRVGVVADYGIAESDTDALALTAAGPVAVSQSSTGHQFLIRPGVSYEYAADSTVFLDYQFAYFDDESGSLDLHRLNAGVDHQFTKGVFGRVGATVDSEGSFAWTAGFGVSPAPWVSIDFAYQHDMFPELGEELGHSDTLTLSASFSL